MKRLILASRKQRCPIAWCNLIPFISSMIKPVRNRARAIPIQTMNMVETRGKFRTKKRTM